MSKIALRSSYYIWMTRHTHVFAPPCLVTRPTPPAIKIWSHPATPKPNISISSICSDDVMGMLNDMQDFKHTNDDPNIIADPFDISFDTDEEAMVLALSFGQSDPTVPSLHMTPTRVSPGILIHSGDEEMANILHAELDPTPSPVQHRRTLVMPTPTSNFNANEDTVGFELQELLDCS